MGFLFGKTAQGTYVVVAFWIACYYFFSGMFPMWHFAPGSMPGLAGSFNRFPIDCGKYDKCILIH